MSPKAQRFVYERWARTMKDRRIDVMDRCGYDPHLLSAVQHDDWFIQTTEPHPNEHYTPVKSVENLMEQFVSSTRLEVESEAHCGAL